MEVRHADNGLQAMEEDPTANGGFPPGIVKVFRKRMQHIRSAVDERDFYAMKSLHYEKLKGDRSHQHSMRLNDQFRLVIEYEERSAERVVVIVGIKDYH
jgi:proteic killer suppression protein